MKGRKPTAEESRYMSAIRQINCVVCRLYHDQWETPAAIHHVSGKTKPGAHFNVIPLCEKHHQHKDNCKHKRWVSRHGDGRAAFEAEYQTEEWLVRCSEKIAKNMGLL